MKSKKLSIVLLVLAIVTVLSAGTLAIYTSSVDIATTSIAAKQFALDATTSGSLSFEVPKLSPGETLSNTVTITNYKGDTIAEVAMRVSAAPSATNSSFFGAFPDAVVTLTLGNVTKTWDANNYANDDAALVIPEAFSADGTQQTINGSLSIKWDDDGKANAEQTREYAGDTFGAFALSIVGTQVGV